MSGRMGGGCDWGVCGGFLIEPACLAGLPVEHPTPLHACLQAELVLQARELRAVHPLPGGVWLAVGHPHPHPGGWRAGDRSGVGRVGAAGQPTKCTWACRRACHAMELPAWPPA